MFYYSIILFFDSLRCDPEYTDRYIYFDIKTKCFDAFTHNIHCNYKTKILLNLQNYVKKHRSKNPLTFKYFYEKGNELEKLKRFIDYILSTNLDSFSYFPLHFLVNKSKKLMILTFKQMLLNRNENTNDYNFLCIILSKTSDILLEVFKLTDISIKRKAKIMDFVNELMWSETTKEHNILNQKDRKSLEIILDMKMEEISVSPRALNHPNSILKVIYDTITNEVCQNTKNKIFIFIDINLSTLFMEFIIRNKNFYEVYRINTFESFTELTTFFTSLKNQVNNKKLLEQISYMYRKHKNLNLLFPIYQNDYFYIYFKFIEFNLSDTNTTRIEYKKLISERLSYLRKNQKEAYDFILYGIASLNFIYSNLN